MEFCIHRGTESTKEREEEEEGEKEEAESNDSLRQIATGYDAHHTNLNSGVRQTRTQAYAVRLE